MIIIFILSTLMHKHFKRKHSLKTHWGAECRSERCFVDFYVSVAQKSKTQISGFHYGPAAVTTLFVWVNGGRQDTRGIYYKCSILSVVFHLKIWNYLFFVIKTKHCSERSCAWTDRRWQWYESMFFSLHQTVDYFSAFFSDLKHKFPLKIKMC